LSVSPPGQEHLTLGSIWPALFWPNKVAISYNSCSGRLTLLAELVSWSNLHFCRISVFMHCVVPENIHTLPMDGHWKFWGGEGLKSQNFQKKVWIKLKWNFWRGGWVPSEKPSVGELCIFSGTTHWPLKTKLKHANQTTQYNPDFLYYIKNRVKSP